MLLMLEMGASKIGPIAENHSTYKRLLALASMLTAIGYSFTTAPSDGLIFLTLFIVVPVLIGAVSEQICAVPSVYRPFLRKGFLGRMFGKLFYPGWPSGVFFALSMFAVCLVQGWYRFYQKLPTNPTAPRDEVQGFIVLTAIVGAFFMPVALLRITRLKLGFPAVFYFLFQAMLSLLSIVGLLFTEYRPQNTMYHGPSAAEQFIDCIPLCALIHAKRIWDWSPNQLMTVLAGVIIFTLLTLLVLGIAMIPAWRGISKLEKIASNLNDARTAPKA
jgi:hypothetical protein